MGDENHLVGQDFVSYYSLEESRRFACEVYRYILEGADPSLMLEQIQRDRADLAIVRIPTSQSELLQPLGAMCQTSVLADCLVIYSRDNLKIGPPGPLKNPLKLRKSGNFRLSSPGLPDRADFFRLSQSLQQESASVAFQSGGRLPGMGPPACDYEQQTLFHRISRQPTVRICGD